MTSSPSALSPNRHSDAPSLPKRRWRRLLQLAAMGLLLLGISAAAGFIVFVRSVFPVPIYAYAGLSPGDEFARIAAAQSASGNEYVGRRKTQRLKSQLAPNRLTPSQRLAATAELAMELLREGKTDEAAREIDSAWQSIAPDVAAGKAAPPKNIDEGFLWACMVVYLRQAEQQNCVSGHCGESCIFPLAGGGIHKRRLAAQKAGQQLEAILARGTSREASARWLRNIAGMAVGNYPACVPEAWRLPESAYRPVGPFPRFESCAAARGLSLFRQAGSVAVDDFVGDARLDLIWISSGVRDSAKLFENQGTRFVERESPRLNEQFGGLHLVTGDYDNDGDRDVFILRGAWWLNHGRVRNSLLRNDGQGQFRDVTWEAGLALPPYPTQSAVWADFDNDGYLDLFVGNESGDELAGLVAKSFSKHSVVQWLVASALPSLRFPCQLFHNRGDGTFEDIAPRAGVTNDRWCKGTAAGDYDNDGDIDLYVSNFSLADGPEAANRLYRNRGDGTFEDVAPALGVEDPSCGFSTWWFDYDNDGWLDLWACANAVELEAFARQYTDGAPRRAFSRVYHNEQGKFRDATRELGLERPDLVMGAGFGDIDNDGWLDVYLGTGASPLEILVPNVLLRNRQGQRFDDVTVAAGLGHLQKGHGIVLVDYDEDGDQDIAADVGGFFPGDQFAKALFENPGAAEGTEANHWLKLWLRGTRTNRQAIGARVRLVVEQAEGQREIHRAAGALPSFGALPPRLEIGLGPAKRIVELEVRWPGLKNSQRFFDVPLDSTIEIVEGEANLRVVTP